MALTNQGYFSYATETESGSIIEHTKKYNRSFDRHKVDPTMTNSSSLLSNITAEKLARLSLKQLVPLSEDIPQKLDKTQLNELCEYGWGNRYKKNYEKAFILYKIAASGGIAKAQSQLAEMLYEGQGTKQDKRSAFEWSIKAAKNGDHEMAGSLLNYVQQGFLADMFGFSQEEVKEKEKLIHDLVNKRDKVAK